MGGEVRLALRRLAKEPALALAAVATLALGIGACTAMFSIVEAVLLKSMDIAQPERPLMASRLLSNLLFGVSATDSRTLIAAAAGVLALGTLACYLPARRAATLDPCRIFREE